MQEHQSVHWPLMYHIKFFHVKNLKPCDGVPVNSSQPKIMSWVDHFVEQSCDELTVPCEWWWSVYFCCGALPVRQLMALLCAHLWAVAQRCDLSSKFFVNFLVNLLVYSYIFLFLVKCEMAIRQLSKTHHITSHHSENTEAHQQASKGLCFWEIDLKLLV